eukprot:scaffold67163_cov66-Phaeocystis_antarctica.AAC.4
MEHCPLRPAICWERHRSFIAHMRRLGREAGGCEARTRCPGAAHRKIVRRRYCIACVLKGVTCGQCGKAF